MAVVNQGCMSALLVNLERIADKGFLLKNADTPVIVEFQNNQLFPATRTEK